MSSHNISKHSFDNIGEREWMHIHCKQLRATSADITNDLVVEGDLEIKGNLDRADDSAGVIYFLYRADDVIPVSPSTLTVSNHNAGEVPADLNIAVNQTRVNGDSALKIESDGVYKLSIDFDMLVYNLTFPADGRKLAFYLYKNGVQVVNLTNVEYDETINYEKSRHISSECLVNGSAGDEFDIRARVNSAPAGDTLRDLKTDFFNFKLNIHKI